MLLNLLAERISVRDLPTIWGHSEACGLPATDVDHRTRAGRLPADQRMNATTRDHRGHAFPEWEQRLPSPLAGTGEVRQLSMAPAHAGIHRARARTFETPGRWGETPACGPVPPFRPYVRSIVERSAVEDVISLNEIHPKARIKTLADLGKTPQCTLSTPIVLPRRVVP